MGIINKIFTRNKNAKTQPKYIRDYTSSINRALETDSVAFSCIDKIATAFSLLSFGVYDANTKQKVPNSEIYELLKEPNAEETHSLFFYNLAKDYYNGNVYLKKAFDAEGNVVSLFRLNPDAVFVTRDENGKRVYSYYDDRYTAEKIIHIPSRFGYDGLKGKSIFKECATAFDTANNLDFYARNSFDKSLGKHLIIDLSEAYPNATDEQMDELCAKWQSKYAGYENAGKPLVKSSRIKFDTLESGVQDNRAAQLSENRDYQLQIIAQIFSVPVEYLTGKDIKDIEAVTTMFMQQAIQPLVRAFEEGFQKLFPKDKRWKYYIEFDYNSILKTSLAAKNTSYQIGIMNGWLTPNDILRKENKETFEGGDYHYRPSNLIAITEENENAYLAQSKKVMTDIEAAETAGTVPDVGSDKM